MNKEEVKSTADLSSFFFENKLYEFSQKTLSGYDREAMKKMTSTSPEAKYKIGMVLLSLEYLERFDQVTMDIDKNELLLAAKRKDHILKFLNFIFFLILTLCFFTSGYFFISTYYKGLLF